MFIKETMFKFWSSKYN